MRVIILIIIFLTPVTGFAQKNPLDILSVDGWPEIMGEKISADGNFIVYTLHNKGQDTTYIQSTNNNWKKILPGRKNVGITNDGRYFCYINYNDSLVLFDTRNRQEEYFSPATSFKLPADNGDFLFYHDKKSKTLAIRSLTGKKEKKWTSVYDYEISGNGAILVLSTDDAGRNLKWVELKNGSEHTIAGGGQYANFIFHNSTDQLAFTEEIKKEGSTEIILRYYKPGMDSAEVKAGNTSKGILQGYHLANMEPSFNKPGDRIFFPLTKITEPPKKDNLTADISIWDYQENFSPPEQKFRNTYRRSYTAVIAVSGKEPIQLNREGELPLQDVDKSTGEFITVKADINWFAAGNNPGNNLKTWVVNTTTGDRKLLANQKEIGVYISPEGKYAIWYDPFVDNYFVYETKTGVERAITTKLKGLLKMRYVAMRLEPTSPYGIAGWLPGDNAVLLYDQYDIWKVDPAGKASPVNLTNGYGRKTKTTLRLWNGQESDFQSPIMSENECLLVGFNQANKDNGFFKMKLAKAADPVKLIMEPYIYYVHSRTSLQFLITPKIQKATNAPVYILRKMSAKDFPNIVLTKDFKDFTPLTDIHPERAYNWMNSELVTWKNKDGSELQGVLYKPENFDPSQKYPVIIYLYEKLSHRLHQYIEPELSGGSINIPFFASNGYLVFTPDVDYKAGAPGASALNAVMSAVKNLSKFPWFDTTRMGIQGHSFGGYQVNYIISHTTAFAAAQESSGASDFISYYNGFYRESSAQFYFETGQGRLGTTLWQNPELFITNSPIFKAPDVTTPLLIMHNKDDGEVPFQQGVEWFTALRRLGKKVWMLQYDKEYHGLIYYKNKLDLTTRQFEFFEHYLKNKPAPGWMKEKIPASFTGSSQVQNNNQ